MPKQTFLNLPEEKRNAFIEIALNEFADNDYNTASVSKIVEKAGIAKGSIYQYFADKQDMFMYLLDVSNRAMLEFITGLNPPDSTSSFFETLRWQMSATVQAALKYPVHSKLLRRAYSSPLPFRDAVFEQARKVREAHFRAMVVQAQSDGYLDLQLDPDLVSFVVQGLLKDLGPFLQSKFGDEPGDWIERPEVGKVFDQIIQVLKNGLGES